MITDISQSAMPVLVTIAIFGTLIVALLIAADAYATPPQSDDNGPQDDRL